MRIISFVFTVAVITACLLPVFNLTAATSNQLTEPVGQIASVSNSNDPYYDKQWALQRMPLPMVDAGSNQILIAVLDTGIAVDHEDLTNKVVESINFTSSATIEDRNGHGTHIAGIIAAERNNGIGVAGAASNVKLLNVKVVEDNGMVWASNVARGIIWATDRGAQVINLSLTLPSKFMPLEEAVNYALDHGVVLVAAAGNIKAVTYPAAYNNVIAVAATTPDCDLWSESNNMDFITAYAPGVSILSTFPGNKYEFQSGTSMASAFVSAEMAQVINQLSDLNSNGRICDEAQELMNMLFPR